MAEDLVADAVDELYGIDPAGFTERRGELVAAARAAGAGEAAKEIAALRRPTRAAWVLNRLARAQPQLARDFAELGARLRTAHENLDGAQLRELTRQRRQLIDQTAVQAFASAGIGLPTAALRDEVTATLGAALAVPEIAERFAAGSLVTAEEQDGFGPTDAPPMLVSVPRPRDDERGKSKRRPVVRRAAQRREDAARAKAEAAVSAAERALREAGDAAGRAGAIVRQLTDQLADARRREDDALLDVRHAELRLHQAKDALERRRGD
jgi:hypothetical protein